MENIRIGTMVDGRDAVRVLPQLAPHGFECYSLTFWQTTGDTDLAETARRVRDIVAEQNVTISSLGIFGNPLTGEGDHADTLASWERLIDHAHLFGTDLVGGFTGRLPGLPLDASIPRYREVFGELAQRAGLCFENCGMDGSWQDGDWNIAHAPSAWELMWDALPAENLGLEWEPCHQMVGLIDPIPQLRKWVPRIFHVHGKDATIAWDVIREFGIHGPRPYVWHRTPGFGDTNWTDVISILHQGNYAGTIDIEGFHDPVYRGELEMTGQVHALSHLKSCRGGAFVSNPV